jgi:hypothetical protein
LKQVYFSSLLLKRKLICPWLHGPFKKKYVNILSGGYEMKFDDQDY